MITVYTAEAELPFALVGKFRDGTDALIVYQQEWERRQAERIAESFGGSYTHEFANIIRVYGSRRARVKDQGREYDISMEDRLIPARDDDPVPIQDTGKPYRGFVQECRDKAAAKDREIADADLGRGGAMDRGVKIKGSSKITINGKIGL